MNALFAPGAKRNRILIALGLALLLASPVMLLWASRQEASSETSEDSPDFVAYQDAIALRYESLVLPAGHDRKEILSPFRDRFKSPRLLQGDTSQYMKTPLGHLDARNPDALLKDVPQELLFKGPEVVKVPRGELVEGLNYVQISSKALAARTLDEIHADIRKDARIVSYVSSNTLIVKVDREHLSSLGRNPDLASAVPDHPAFRIDLDLGRRTLINKKAAESDDLVHEVYVAPGSDSAAVGRALGKIEGVRSVKSFGADGFEVVAHYSATSKIAKLQDVLHVKERTEFMENNAKNVPTMQLGSWEDSLQGMRPYDTAGVDGGGLPNAAGDRLNDGSSQVPPQIVGVTDNGISVDSAGFAQSATSPATLTNPVGPTHRKVHFIQNITDDGTTCDSTLSGAGTHGNVVASTIAAYSSQLGFFMTRAGIGGGGQPRNENLDGVARGARIIMQDAGDIGQCTVNSLVERGGNVTPGRLLDDMNKLICPRSGGGIGPLCTGIDGGGNEIHIAVLPFGAPDKFSNVRFPSSNGTYPQEAVDLDTFLYNNKDFSIVSPVGNSGANPGGTRPQTYTSGLQLPDLFDGTSADDNPNTPNKVQVQPPSTAKNVISVGSSGADDVTRFGNLDTENSHDNFASRGPVGDVGVLRTAPILIAPGSDLLSAPVVGEIAAFRSRDNDNSGDVEAQLDSGNFGTSYAAGYIGGAGAVIRDYFAQGFYPTGDRVALNRVPGVSGSLVKAALIASAKFSNRTGTLGQRNGSESPDAQVRRTRAMNMSTIAGANIGVLGNSEQGYGRPILSQVLPLSNLSKSYVIEPNAPIGPQGTVEHPAGGLLIWDDIATHEPLLNNTTHTSAAHLFKVGGTDVIDANGSGTAGGLAINNAELRIGLAWTDVPSAAGSGGPLVNDLDMTLEGPGPDNCLFTGDIAPDGSTCGATAAADNEFFDGSVYHGGRVNSITDPWSLRRLNATGEIHDTRNPHEGIHMSSRYSDTPIYLGTYRITVRRGTAGKCSNDATIACFNDSPCVTGGGTCTPNRQLSGLVAVSEDANGNRRLDPGVCSNNAQLSCFNNSGCVSPGTCVGSEDTNQNGLLDLDGQAFSLVVAGPVFLNEAAPSFGPQTYPQASISFSSLRYSCSDSAVANVFDVSAGAGAARSQTATTFQVVNASGVVVDSESNIGFVSPGTCSNATSATTACSVDSDCAAPAVCVHTPGASSSVGIPVRLPGTTTTGSPTPISNDGILEVDTGQQIVANYSFNGRTISAKAQVSCTPDLVNAFFLIDSALAIGDQDTIGGGCDGDEFLDAGETVTYGVALLNRSRTDRYTDVQASLSASGPGASFIRILDPQKNLGLMPGSAVDGAFFHISVLPGASDPAQLPVANRKVTFTLNLDASSKGVRLNRQTYTFTHAINADRDTKHYSTDFPGGGREVRDLNRNLLIDQADVTDPFQLISLPDEDVTFSSMFVAGDSLSRITNSIGEDLNNNGVLDPGEDVQPNTQIDPGILAKGTTAPSAGDHIPWNFDRNNGGWAGFRHPSSTAPAPANLMVWEYKTSGLCGFQTSAQISPGVGSFGIWHTGDGDPTTPSASASACDNYLDPTDQTTGTRAELYFDVLHSPIISKVNQLNDARGFPYTVEFQRFGANLNLQTADSYAGGGINIDNDVDSDTSNCMLCQEMDVYYTRRFGGWNYTVFKFAGLPFAGPGYYGINPSPYSGVHQRTFGPYLNPDGSAQLSGDETGFTGKTQNNDVYSRSPIPTQSPDFIPFPLPDAGPLDPTPVAGVCTGGDKPGSPCQTNRVCVSGTNNGHLCTSNGDCTGGGTCFTPPTCPGGGVCTLASNTIAGPVRNFEGSLVGYEGGFSAPQEGIASIEAQQQGAAFIPGKGGNRWQIGIGFFAIESGSPLVSSDYGFGVDDVVFEWDETHPLDETQFSPAHTPACARFGQPGQPAGLQCATVTADRTNLYECEESIEVTVFDPNKLNAPNVQVSVTTDSDSVHVTTQRFTVNQPGTKRFTLLPAGTPGLYKGNITFSSQADNPTHIFTNPGTDATFTVYYADPTCDGDGDGQAGEIDFANLDGDGIADDGDHDLVAGDHPCRGGATVNCDDNCPLIYNPTQADSDNDGVGDICDNCPSVYQRVCSNRNSAACQTDADCLFTINGQPNQGTCRSDQTSHNPNGIGDVCAYDDVDGDGVDNLNDNCPDVYNPGQEVAQGSSGRGVACSGNGDLDLDGIVDKSDNCVLTYNNTQSNLDQDKLGDACDGDCPNITPVRICSNAPATTCTADANCPVGGFCQTEIRHSAGTCSLVDNDEDADGITDALDDCPVTYNPAIIPGTTRQLDTDRDGLGDACDPDGSQDDDFNGIPDDLPQFSGTINCKIASLNLAKLVVVSTNYKDVNGDQDAFPDPGEFGRVQVVVKNTGATLTGVAFHLTSGDPDVACINSSTFIYKGCSNAPSTACTVDANCPAGGVCQSTIPAGTQVTLSDFDASLPVDPNRPGFFFTASTTLKSLPGLEPAKVNLCMTVTANEALGVSAPICFNLQGDLNLKQVCSNAPATVCTSNADCTAPGVCQAAGQTFTAGPQGGVPGTLFENFDNDANGDTNFTVTDTFFHQGQTGIDVDAHGSYLRGGDSGINVIAGVACFGFTDPQGGNAACRLNPSFPMDWHFHCAHGDTRCPNTESGTIAGSCATTQGTACSFGTPINGARGLPGGTTANSLEMGVHTNDADSLLGDTVHLRTLAAFVSAPMNMAVFPRPGDLVMSFYQIADLCTGGGNCVSGPELGYDNADVQIRIDRNPDPATDDWGFWDKLVPFENVYDHKAGAFSAFTPIGYYCNFTPADTGTAPPAPRGFHETMCFPMQIWSKCGDIRGTSTANTRACSGGSSTRIDPSGRGVWVQSKFNLTEFLGQRVQIRWIGQTWMFDAVTDDYIAAGGGFATSLENDGWWIDDILVTGTITQQVSPVPDLKTPPTVNCSAPLVAGACNPGLGADHGTTVILQATDANNNPLDGVSHLAVSGQALRISAVASTIPGGCVNGAAQFQFFKNGALVQDWSSKTFLEDSPDVDTTYGAKERCSSDPTDCTSQNMVQTPLQVYRGDSSEIQLTVTLSGGNTVLTWPWRPQPFPMAGYAVFRGPLPFNLATMAKASCAVAQPSVGTPVTYQEATAAGSVYYLVGHRNAQTAGSFPALGLSSSNAVIVSPISCP